MILSSAERIARFTERGWWGQTTADDLLRAAVGTHSDQDAVVDPPNRSALIGTAARRLTYGELDVAVDQLAALLHELGLRKDDVLATQLPNVVEAVVALLACARMGAILCPISMQYRGHELRYMLAKSRARMMFTVDRFKEARPADAALALQPEIDTLAHVLVLGSTAENGEEVDEKRLAAADRGALARHLQRTTIDANDVLTICWTSGTEARPKGVPRSHNQWIANGRVCTEIGRVQAGDALLNPFPMVNMASIGGVVMVWLLNRGKLVQHHPLDLPVFLAQLQHERVAYTIAPPPLLSQLLKNEEILARTDLSALRAIGSGSAPLAPWMVAGWQRRYGIAIANIFGSNEGCALFSTAENVPDPEDRAQFFPRFGVSGLTWPTRSAEMMRTRLVDLGSGEEITEPGHTGELRHDGAMRFDGYWDEAGLNREAFDEQGYFRSGDLFEIAGDGERRRLYRFVGRAKDVIIRGGMKISPAELDALIEGHPDIQEAAFCGVPDDVLSERVGIVVVPRPGRSVSLESVIAYLHGAEVATFKLPERMAVIEELPRNALGKVLRRNLPALFGTTAQPAER